MAFETNDFIEVSNIMLQIYDTMERNEAAFAKREAELRMGGNLLTELRKARAKLRYFEEAPLLPGFDMEDLK